MIRWAAWALMNSKNLGILARNLDNGGCIIISPLLTTLNMIVIISRACTSRLLPNVEKNFRKNL